MRLCETWLLRMITLTEAESRLLFFSHELCNPRYAPFLHHRSPKKEGSEETVGVAGTGRGEIRPHVAPVRKTCHLRTADTGGKDAVFTGVQDSEDKGFSERHASITVYMGTSAFRQICRQLFRSLVA